MTVETTTDASTTALGAAAAATKVEGDKVTGAEKVVDANSPEGKAAAEATKATEEKATKDAADLAAKPFTDVAQLKLPENFKVDADAVKELSSLGVTAAQAQKLLELNAKMSSSAEAARTASRDTAMKAAVEALKGDKEIGGAQFDKSMALAGKALSYIGSPELNEALAKIRLEDGSMLGDNLVFAKVLVSLGKKVAEDTTNGTHNNGVKTPANDPGAMQRSMYPNTKTLKFD